MLIGEIRNDKLKYHSVTSCLTPIGNLQGKHIVTVEGINLEVLSPVQQAMNDEAATQCGFCTVGIVMSLTGFCLNYSEESTNAVAAVDGNICRCTGYKSIEKAANKVGDLLKLSDGKDNIKYLVDNNFIPAYFLEIEQKLKNLNSNTIPNSEQIINRINVGGGSDLYVQKHDTMVDASINFIADVESMKGIIQEDNNCLIGASTTVTEMMESEIINKYFPDFKSYAKLVSSTPIRNIATLGGNFTNASPIGDFTIFYLALNATLILNDGKVKREILLKDYYKGYKTLNKNSEELIEKLYFELPNANTYFNFEKVSKRTHLDIASVNTAIKIDVENDVIKAANLSAGGIGPIPSFLTKTCEYLVGKTINAETILGCIEFAQTEVTPISDARGTEKYKRLLLGQLIKAHFIKMFDKVDLVDELIF